MRLRQRLIPRSHGQAPELWLHRRSSRRVALETESPASLSGRCAVFTESDITHLYQKGTPRNRIAAGVHQAISRNYRSAIARGKEFRDKVAFIGGVSENPRWSSISPRNSNSAGGCSCRSTIACLGQSARPCAPEAKAEPARSNLAAAGAPGKAAGLPRLRADSDAPVGDNAARRGSQTFPARSSGPRWAWISVR